MARPNADRVPGRALEHRGRSGAGNPTVTTDPFFASTQLATLDYVSGGRAGWSVIVSERESDPEYVGPRSASPVGDRFAEAAEYIEAVRRLWDSWEDDAEIRDATTNRFVDRERLQPHRLPGPLALSQGALDHAAAAARTADRGGDDPR